MVFTSVAALFIDSGLSQALIQRNNISHVDESSVFFFNLLVAILAVIVMCLGASSIAVFYDQPVLKQVTIAMAFNLLINSFGSIHIAILIKALNFKTIAKASGIATIFSGILAVIAAANHFGVWSLVVQILSSSLLTVVMLWVLSPWRPKLVFSLNSIRSFFGFSSYLLLSGLLDCLYNNVYALIIGKVYSPQEVGYFNQAQRLQQLPINLMTSIVSRIAFPVFSKATEDHERLVRLMNKALRTTVFMTVPIVLCMLLLAKPLVLALFGFQWLPSVPVLQVLSLTGLIWPFHVFNVSMLKALGRADLNFRIMLVKFIVGLSLLIAASPYGMVAMAWAIFLASFLSLFVNIYYINKFLDHGVSKQVGIAVPYVIAGAPMAAVIIFINESHQFEDMICLLVSLFFGGAAYLMACKLANLSALNDLLSIIKGR